MVIPVAADPSKILLGEGAFYFNYDEAGQAIIGAVRGGGSFGREVNIREMEYDGSLGPTKGLRRRTRAVAQIKFNSVALSAENITKYYAGLEATAADPKVITAKGTGIADSDYLTNVAFVGLTKDGRDVIIIVKNALGDGNINFAVSHADEVVPEIQYTGHYDPLTPTVEPWEIRWPVDSPVASMTINPSSLAEGYAAQNLIVSGTNTHFTPGVTTLAIIGDDDSVVTGASTVSVFSYTAASVSLAAGLTNANSTYTVRLTTGTEVVEATLTITV